MGFSGGGPLERWLRTALFLPRLDVVKQAYSSSYERVPRDLRGAFYAKDSGYLSDIYHSLDLLLCMLPYRDLQYGPKGGRGAPELRRRMKLAWIAYNMRASQELLNNWGRLRGSSGSGARGRGAITGARGRLEAS